MVRRLEQKGLIGLVHGNRERVPVNKKPAALRKLVMDLVEEKYFGFNMTHYLEKLKELHMLTIPFATLRRWYHSRQLVK